MIAYFFDLDSNPITFERYMEILMEKHAARAASGDGSSMPEDDPTRIGWDERGDVSVSTVWLGLNHNWGVGPPLIFETTIFGGSEDGYQERYPTRFAAELGHKIACQLAFGDKP